MPADWTELLADAGVLTDAYTNAPALDRCKLPLPALRRARHLRHTRPQHRRPAGPPLPEWEAKPFNSLTFYLVCEEITEVALNGWELPAPILQLASAAAGVNVVAEAGGSSLHLTAGAVRIEGVRTTLVSETAT